MNQKRAFSYLTILIVILIPLMIYLLTPKGFWDTVGSKTFTGPTVGSSDGSSTSTPTSLRFIDPFKYDNYKPSKKDEFMKKREENQKDKDGKTIFWSR